VLRLNDDGSHSCEGKWATAREHFNGGETSNFSFKLDPANGEDKKFPLDSAMYKGSFQLKQLAGRYQTIVDQQMVLKYCINSEGSFNVYGKGKNEIGTFNLVGTLVMDGEEADGQLELYRIYPPELLKAPKTAAAAAHPPALPGRPGMSRRESSRIGKLPSKLEDDDAAVLLSRTMSKCSQILRIVMEKDVELGAFFRDPVDPVALGIPTYTQIIKEPMALRTVHRCMEATSIGSPEEFGRLVRLVFENAMTFNIDPAHSVHQAARNLLVMFNQKFRDVEHMIQKLRKTHGGDMKRKREERKSPKQIRLEEAHAMASSNARAMAAIVGAASEASSVNVSRSEFSMLLTLIQDLQKHVVQTHTAIAELSAGDENDTAAFGHATSTSALAMAPSVPVAQASAPERKRPVKRKAVEAFVEDPAIDESDMRLTIEEQELLTETINDLPPEHLGGIIQIIREAAPVGADEDEIDLEIDQLDTKTQRKLLKHVMKVRI
jgi:hypothetical protein